MGRIIGKKVTEMKNNEWKLRFNGKNIAFKDLAEPVLGIIKLADKYVTDALSANPYASIAWAGVGLILPLFLNPSAQAASVANGLKTISDLIVQSSMREALYAHRYESQNNPVGRKKLESVHIGYRDTLQEQYSLILKFQASCVCYCYRSGVTKFVSGIVKWDDWDSSLQEIEKQDVVFCKLYEILKDTMQEEEYDKLSMRHEENSKIMDSIAGDMSSLKRAIEIAQSDERRRQLLQWLSNVDPSENYRNALEKCKTGTGSWLIEDHRGYESWKKSPNSLLWLHGKAGSGKSVLSSSIIKSLEDDYYTNPEVAIAYFYFSFNDQKKQNTDEMMCSLIRQIWYKRPDNPPIVGKLDQYEKKNHRPDLGTLEQTLAAMICGFSNVYIIIDALDECPNEVSLSQRQNLLKALRKLHLEKFLNVHLLCTSRSQSDIEAILNPLIHSSTALAIDLDTSDYTRLVQKDICLFLDETFSSENYEAWPDSIKNEAKDVLTKKAEGMFQYVSCQLDVLEPLRREIEIIQALKDLPIGLDATYDRMLEAVEPRYKMQVVSILKWLCFSTRPLCLDELAEVFILDAKSDVPFDDKQRLFRNEDVLACMPNLVTRIPRKVQGRERIGFYGDVIEIRFAHFSIQEYLLSRRIQRPESPVKDFSITETDAHLHIAESCLAYHLRLSKDILATQEKFKQFNLWSYAVKYFGHHLDKASRQSWPAHVTSLAVQIFTPRTQSVLNIIRPRNPDGLHKNWQLGLDDLASPLYYAASIGPLALAEELIERGHSIHNVSERSEYGSALAAAAVHQNKSIVQLLLERGADINLEGGLFGNALQAAATVYNNKSIVQLLLDRGADINLRGGYYGTVLQAAAWYKNESIVHLLLNKGANVNLQGGYYETALQAAVIYGHRDIAQLLLDRGANINLQGGHYGTALQAALIYGRKSTVHLLLDRGADTNLQGGCYESALQAAAQHGDKSMSQLLLDRGADVNLQGGYYGTALQAASVDGRERTVQLLLDRGADINLQGGYHGTALQAASVDGRERTVQLLLDRGADINLQGGYYGTALQAASVDERESTVQLLLDRGADINLQGGYHGTALQAASAYGRERTVQLLLDRGADINLQGGYHGTALQAAASISRGERIVQLLIEKGAEVNFQGGIFGNALQAAIAEKEHHTVKLLLSHGAQITPPGLGRDNLLLRMEKNEYSREGCDANLRRFWEDPEGFLAKLQEI